METIETLSRRIEATQDLQSLVRSMKTLSVISISQFEKAERSLDHFGRTIDMGLQIVLRNHPAHETATPPAERTMLVLFGSDRGLCGNFNDNAARLTDTHLTRSEPRDGAPYLLVIGGQLAARLETLGREADEVMMLPGSVQGLAETCEKILIRIDRFRHAHGLGRVECIYNRRGPDADILPTAHVILPVPIKYLNTLAAAPWPSRRLPDFTVEPNMLFSWLIRQHLFVSLYRAGLASMASENAARLAAMQNADRNIADQLEAMVADFRHLRQESITNELMDITAGYEVLRDRK
jgi:F-type H+-transporting ATPase subunit gamma